LFWIKGHLAAPAAELERADDAVVQHLADVHMARGVHHAERRVEQALLLLARDAPIAHRLGLLVQPNTKAVEGGPGEEW